MKRRFKDIVCIYHDDKNYIPAKFSCPELEIDDVLLDLTTDAANNYEKIAKMIVDYAFALFCNKTDVSDFAQNPAKYNRGNWKLLDFKDATNTAETPTVKKTDVKNEQNDAR